MQEVNNTIDSRPAIKPRIQRCSTPPIVPTHETPASPGRVKKPTIKPRHFNIPTMPTPSQHYPSSPSLVTVSTSTGETTPSTTPAQYSQQDSSSHAGIFRPFQPQPTWGEATPPSTPIAPRHRFPLVDTSPPPIHRQYSFPRDYSEHTSREASPQPLNRHYSFPQNYSEPTLGEALRSGNYQISWTRCADLPVPLYGASVAVQNRTIYVSAGCAPNVTTYQYIFCYDIDRDMWSRLPSPGHILGILCIVDGKVNVFGGNNAINEAATNKVSTLKPDTNTWIQYFPNMLSVRTKPGVVVYLEHIIVAGGARNKINFHNDIEILNWQQPEMHWQRVDISLPVPMWAISLAVSGEKLLIVGYTQAKGRSASVYQLPVMSLFKKSLPVNALQSDHTWVKLCSAPHHDTALVPHSNPPVVVGGSTRGLPTSDVCVYSASRNCWVNYPSLYPARINTAVATINNGAIIMIGGNTRGTSIEVALESTLTTVEMGKLKKLTMVQPSPEDNYMTLTTYLS